MRDAPPEWSLRSTYILSCGSAMYGRLRSGCPRGYKNKPKFALTRSAANRAGETYFPK